MTSIYKLLATVILVLITCRLAAQMDYPQWPADKPEAGYIADSKSREIRLRNSILPQEVDMQDKMRVLITDMMEDAANKLGWNMVELSEYTNQNALQGGGTPYNLRSPRGIGITFQFIVNKDSLSAWKNYQSNYMNTFSKAFGAAINNEQSLMESPQFKQYMDSANYYTNLGLTSSAAHDNKDGLKYYEKKVTEFMNKEKAMGQKNKKESGVEQLKVKGEIATRLYRNHTVVQVQFGVNSGGNALNQSSGPIKFTTVPFTKNGTTISRLFSVSEKQDNYDLIKWNYVIMMLLGNFQLKPDEQYNYSPGFKLNGQENEHTPKKIKSDKVQIISINIYGDKTNIEKMANLIDVEKLNNEIVKK